MSKKGWLLLVGLVLTIWCGFTGAHIWHVFNDKTNWEASAVVD